MDIHSYRDTQNGVKPLYGLQVRYHVANGRLLTELDDSESITLLKGWLASKPPQ